MKSCSFVIKHNALESCVSFCVPLEALFREQSASELQTWAPVSPRFVFLHGLFLAALAEEPVSLVSSMTIVMLPEAQGVMKTK